MRNVNYLGIVVLALMTGLTGFALTWEKTSLDLILPAGTGELVAEFPFKNEGTGTVTIRELASSCGCSTPTVKSRTIPAGDTGIVTVVYVAGDRMGLQTARLIVTTDEVGVAPASLSLKVDIQPALTLTPRLVQWTKADRALTRTIAIKQLSSSAVRILDVKPAGDALAAELKAGAEAGTWLLTLTPKSLEQPSTTKVEIHVQAGERKLTYTVFGIVR
ncbi:MAG: hypothetical protein K0R17_1513 [Rariglobus sp.]|jgi:hypothetical protein|nr:hypothetical protein [Rariglobus sp.]